MDGHSSATGIECSLCSKSVISSDTDPAEINIVANITKPKEQQADQFFWCHFQCFRNKINPSFEDSSDYVCVLCNQMINAAVGDPSLLEILTNFDKDKSLRKEFAFYCHMNCFGEVLHGMAKNYFMVPILVEGRDRRLNKK